MPAWLDKLLKRQTPPVLEDRELEAFFTDVEHLRSLFYELVAAPTLPKRLLVIHGVGGVGKSTLLRIYRLHCKRQGVPVALVSGDEVKTPVEVLQSFVRSLEQDGLKLSSTQKTLDRYRAIQAKVEQERSKLGDVATKVGSKAVEVAAGYIPVVGPVVAAFGGVGTEAFIDWLRGFLSRPDLELYLEPVGKLTQDFLKDLIPISEKRRLVLLLDTYEQMAGLDEWICDLVQQLPANVLIVVAGRVALGATWERDWPGWMAHARVEALEAMDEEHMRTLVRRYYATIHSRGEPDSTQVEEVIDFARGLPLVVTSAVRLWVCYGVHDFRAVKPEIVADLVDRLMEGIPLEIRPTLETAATLRWFNKEVLRALLPAEQVEQVYEEIRNFPFIRPRAEGLALHDMVREMLDENLKVHDPERHRSLHEKAAAYFESQLDHAISGEREHLTLELLYHRLQVNEAEGIALLERLFEEANRLGQQVHKHRLLNEASRFNFKNPQYAYRLKHLVARSTNDWQERERLCQELLGKDLDDEIRPRVLRDLAEALSFQGKPTETRQCLQEALVICERLGNPLEIAWTRLQLFWRVDDEDEARDHIKYAIGAFEEAQDEYGLAIAELEMGYSFLNRWQAAEARAAFSRSLSLQEKLGQRRDAAMAQERIGQTYLIEGDFHQAIISKEKALEVFEELQDEWSIAWTLDELATCLIWVGQWESTLSLLERARTIFAAWSDHREKACVMRQADIYRKQGRLELAMETYQRILNGMPLHGAWTEQGIYGGVGHIHLVQGKFDDALKNYQRAIASFRNRGMELEAKMVGDSYLGRLYLKQGCLDDAIDHFATSLEAARSANNQINICFALVGMCQTCYKQGNLDQLNILLGQAKEVGQKYKYFQFLADMQVLQGHVALDKTSAKQDQLATVINLYGLALKDALRFNRYKLDDITQGIIDHCQGQGHKGRQVLTALRDFWQTNTLDENKSLVEAERIAREREPGDGSPQQTVLEQIEGD